MNKDEFAVYQRKYLALEEAGSSPEMGPMIQLYDAALRAFVQEPGFEILWEAETQARIVRQGCLATLPRHA